MNSPLSRLLVVPEIQKERLLPFDGAIPQILDCVDLWAHANGCEEWPRYGFLRFLESAIPFYRPNPVLPVTVAQVTFAYSFRRAYVKNRDFRLINRIANIAVGYRHTDGVCSIIRADDFDRSANRTHYLYCCDGKRRLGIAYGDSEGKCNFIKRHADRKTVSDYIARETK